MQIEVTNKRNDSGVKNSSDQYRTFNGQHYICWMSYINDDLITAYKKAAVRIRRIKSDLYVHHLDIDRALEVDKSRNYH